MIKDEPETGSRVLHCDARGCGREQSFSPKEWWPDDLIRAQGAVYGWSSSEVGNEFDFCPFCVREAGERVREHRRGRYFENALAVRLFVRKANQKQTGE